MGLEVSFANLQDTTSFFSDEFDVPAVVITICCALAIYNALELLLLIFTTFRRFRGLYFWSLLVASFGVLPYTFGFMIEYFKLTAQLAGLLMTSAGWPMMVTGQSLVLYSRLYVVLGKGNYNILRAVKWMIIVNGVVFHLSTEVAVFGAYYAHPRHQFAAAYKYIEKIQMTGFTIQEFILSGLYVWKTLDILRTSTVKRRTSRIMWQLFSINVLIVIMDIALLVVEYQDRHVIEQALKQVIYSVKLKLEFAILSKLVGLTKDPRSGEAFTAAFDDYDEEFLSSSGQTAQRTDSALMLDLSTISPQASAQSQSLDVEKRGGADFIEQSMVFSGHALRLSSVDERAGRQSRLSVGTAEEQRKRRTVDEDLYANALRDVG